ncbi:MAG TPA: 50S ribosomal protein L25 [Candidatus Dojkabacteria bacterium]|nr:50S ribosomal protein L25 [Candidatus Dojkabacteria bacterium]
MEKILFLERDINGKKNKILREEGFIPAVVYNSKTESKNIMLDSSTAQRIAREATSTTIFDVELEGKEFKALVKEIDYNPVTDDLRHIAFFSVDETADMVFTIPFELVGVAPAVKNNLGVLIQVLDDIEVRCKVSEIIPSINVDISNLEHPGQSIGVDELNIPEALEIMNEDLKNATVVTITELQSEKILEPETTEDEETTEEGEEGASAEEDKATETEEVAE